MKAALLLQPGAPLELAEIALADPIDEEVLLEVRASGICHSDVTASRHMTNNELPLVLGHEVAGVVLAIGPGVRGIAVGDHVVACEIRHCGRCDDCLMGRSFMCTRVDETERGSTAPPRATRGTQTVHQFSHIGGFAEQILLHRNNVVVIPQDVPFELAAVMGCGVVTGAGAAINTAQVRVGDTVAVIGCGGVGLSAIAGARIAGARQIIAVDVLTEKLGLAREFGATHTIDASQSDPVEAVRELTGGTGVLHAFECIGLEATTFQALAMAREVGTAYLIGVHPPETVLSITPFTDLMMPKKSLRMVYMGSSNFRVDIPLYLDYWRQGRFPLDRLVGRTIALHEINDAFSRVGTDGVARTVITEF